ncbi:hypothetical protein TBLA_0E01260 [Henningerozyma blattae CBS 6284]|uniref:Uncharacterized protein n=1 Tax=Henningerozyma blattae (strain ATCC 34711 / CBS 6284 / DSM 70876 / NBRC 10599 / NRRL Y-10934 / UCD 77-7) TaxID=1071380 RepID=I2H484_HENB6|nr:hypothetical protein TBLA_0E01260 [Tetrapisispora blattae CBS 6284]CCH61186.1 hypothetical protein TBLA_0E01260 [Tetrapisispora blattae CBS 6284]
MSGFLKDQIVSAGQGFLQDSAVEFAGEHFQPTRDPYYVKIDDEGNRKRLKLPDYCTKQESKAYKRLQSKAWMHDRSVCGCCCWTDTIGWGPMLSILPVIGPALMYWVHNKLIKQATKDFELSGELVAKMHGNIAIDLAISLVPLLGVLFSWLHACSTRNCAMVYNFIVKRAIEKHSKEEAEKLARESEKGNRGVLYEVKELGDKVFHHGHRHNNHNNDSEKKKDNTIVDVIETNSNTPTPPPIAAQSQISLSSRSQQKQPHSTPNSNNQTTIPIPPRTYQQSIQRNDSTPSIPTHQASTFSVERIEKSSAQQPRPVPTRPVPPRPNQNKAPYPI